MTEYLSVAEAAQALSVNRRTIWRLINQGRLRAITNPTDRRAKLVRREDVEKVAQPESRDESPDSSYRPWPSTIGTFDLGVQSDEVAEWLEANWRPVGLADAAVVACAEQHGEKVLTLDHHFSVVAREGTITVLPGPQYMGDPPFGARGKGRAEPAQGRPHRSQTAGCCLKN